MSELSVTKNPTTTKKIRLPRFKRVKNPPRMLLTKRDREILHAVYQYRLLTREQIERLLFPPDHGQDHFTKTSKARKRLRLAYHHRLLERMVMSVDANSAACRPVYRLARKGAELVAADLGMSIEQLPYWGKGDDKDRRRSKTSHLFLEHTLAVNDVRIAFTQEAIAQGYRIEAWVDDSLLKRWQLKAGVTTAGQPVFVIPDAYILLNIGGRRTHLFLELDRATMSAQRWKRRVGAYVAYLASGRYQEQFQMQSDPRVLTVTTSDQRLANLQHATAQVKGTAQFWFTTFKQVINEKVLSSPIWRLANDERDSARKSLVG